MSWIGFFKKIQNNEIKVNPKIVAACKFYPVEELKKTKSEMDLLQKQIDDILIQQQRPHKNSSQTKLDLEHNLIDLNLQLKNAKSTYESKIKYNANKYEKLLQFLRKKIQTFRRVKSDILDLKYEEKEKAVYQNISGFQKSYLEHYAYYLNLWENKTQVISQYGDIVYKLDSGSSQTIIINLWFNNLVYGTCLFDPKALLKNQNAVTLISKVNEQKITEEFKKVSLQIANWILNECKNLS
ncbi:hypothetical protein [[Mycoplasma] testudinis]|uniref:hypothetical protein n=1 Tax=[Mycoplasma] testudinis TaxID=33924 RepID=UPI0004824841|nr:hypothetical protein [[Mycoplasma] testudinis]